MKFSVGFLVKARSREWGVLLEAEAELLAVRLSEEKPDPSWSEN